MKEDIPNIGHLFSLSRDPVLCEREGLITDMNSSAAALFGGNMIGRPISSLLPDSILSPETDTFVSKTEIAGKNATVSCVSYNGAHLYSFIIPDTPEEKPVEQPFSVSLREITNTIHFASNQIAKHSRINSDEKMNYYAAILNHSASKLKRLVKNYTLLTACADGSQVFHPVMASINDLCSSIVDAVADLSEPYGITVEFFCDCEVLSCVDPDLFQRMLLNLLSNSLLHSSAGGTIQVHLKATSSLISITIADNGSGIPSNLLSTVFSRRDEPVAMDSGYISAGFGLGVADSIAKLHDGVIMIQSEEGKGTTVAIRLKRREDNSLMAYGEDYKISMSDTMMTELSTWLSHEDYLTYFDD